MLLLEVGYGDADCAQQAIRDLTPLPNPIGVSTSEDHCRRAAYLASHEYLSRFQ